MKDLQIHFRDTIFKQIKLLIERKDIEQIVEEYMVGRLNENRFELFYDKEKLQLLEGYIGNISPAGRLLLETEEKLYYLGEFDYADIQEEIIAINILMNNLDEVLHFSNEPEAIYITWILVRYYVILAIESVFSNDYFLPHSSSLSRKQFIDELYATDMRQIEGENKIFFTLGFAAFVMVTNNSHINNPYGIFYYMSEILMKLPELIYDEKIEKRKRSDKFTNSGRYNLKTLLNKVDKMTGQEFEEFLGTLYLNMGYNIEYTPRSGDQGIDLLVRRGNEYFGIQAKRYAKNVSNGAVQEAHAGVGFYGLQKGIVITNSAFTKSAQELAVTLGIVLLDRKELTNLVREYM